MNHVQASQALGRGWFWRGFRVQCQVIGALMMRELHTRYGRDNVGYLWVILEPMMLAGAVASLHAGNATHYASDIRPVPMAICGYCVFIIFRGIFTRSEGALEANMPLLYHRMVTVFDMLASRALLEGAGTTTTLVILTLLGAALGYGDLPARPLQLLLGVVLMIWFAFGCAMLCCSFTHENRLAGRIVHPMTYILMPMSGAFFRAIWIPEPYRSYLVLFPMVQIFEQVRYGMFESASNTYADVSYIVVWCMVLTLLGLLALRVVRHHVHLH